MGFIASVNSWLERLKAACRFAFWHIGRRFRKSATVSTKQGVFTLPMDIDDPISRSLYVNGEFELDLISSAMNLIRSRGSLPRGNGTVLDIGANNGVICIGMIVTGEVNHAIAVEPDPRNFSNLQRNVRNNHLEGAVTCLNIAASDGRKKVPFELSEWNYGDHRVHLAASATGIRDLYQESSRKIIDVEADSPDNILAALGGNSGKDISVVWIDVQGYEGYVYRGSRLLISRGIPVVSEIWPYGIRRAGMTGGEFCGLVAGLWPAYWVKRRGRFEKFAIDTFGDFFAKIGYAGDFENVIFTE